jgi:hypothetical protein
MLPPTRDGALTNHPRLPAFAAQRPVPPRNLAIRLIVAAQRQAAREACKKAPAPHSSCTQASCAEGRLFRPRADGLATAWPTSDSGDLGGLRDRIRPSGGVSDGGLRRPKRPSPRTTQTAAITNRGEVSLRGIASVQSSPLRPMRAPQISRPTIGLVAPMLLTAGQVPRPSAGLRANKNPDVTGLYQAL